MRAQGVSMWTKLYETQDGLETGCWQWFSLDAPRSDATLPVRLESGQQGLAYPGLWMPSDAICAPPDVGLCITNTQYSQKNQARMSTR